MLEKGTKRSPLTGTRIRKNTREISFLCDVVKSTRSVHLYQTRNIQNIK